MNKLAFIKAEINYLNGVDQKPGKIKSLKSFFSRLGYAAKLIFLEKEIITFAMLQWASIALGYYLWVQMLDWIPEEVWKSTESSN